MTVGERIRAARIRCGLTQRALGNRAWIAEPTIRRYELGNLNPKIETIKKIAKAMSVPQQLLMGEQPFPDPFLLVDYSEDQVIEKMRMETGDVIVEENAMFDHKVNAIEMALEYVEINESGVEKIVFRGGFMEAISSGIFEDARKYKRYVKPRMGLTDIEREVLNQFDRLNDDGKEKAVELVSDLADDPKYQKRDHNEK